MLKVRRCPVILSYAKRSEGSRPDMMRSFGRLRLPQDDRQVAYMPVTFIVALY